MTTIIRNIPFMSSTPGIPLLDQQASALNEPTDPLGYPAEVDTFIETGPEESFCSDGLSDFTQQPAINNNHATLRPQPDLLLDTLTPETQLNPPKVSHKDHEIHGPLLMMMPLSIMSGVLQGLRNIFFKKKSAPSLAHQHPLLESSLFLVDQLPFEPDHKPQQTQSPTSDQHAEQPPSNFLVVLKNKSQQRVYELHLQNPVNLVNRVATSARVFSIKEKSAVVSIAAPAIGSHIRVDQFEVEFGSPYPNLQVGQNVYLVSVPDSPQKKLSRTPPLTLNTIDQARMRLVSKSIDPSDTIQTKVPSNTNDPNHYKQWGLSPNRALYPRRADINLSSLENIHGAFSASTHEGIGYKSRNEDAIVYNTYKTPSGRSFYAVVIDGMGGHANGDKAAELTGNVILKQMSHPHKIVLLEEALSVASENIRAEWGADDKAPGSVAAGFQIIEKNGQRFAHIVNVGDAAIKVLRRNPTGQWFVVHATKNETPLDENDFSNPFEIKAHPDSHYVSNALGTGFKGVFQVEEIALLPGDRIVGMSDGLSDNISIEELLASCSQHQTAQEMKNDLLQISLKKMKAYQEAMHDMTSLLIQLEDKALEAQDGELIPMTGFGYEGYFVNRAARLIMPDRQTPINPTVPLAHHPGYRMSRTGGVVNEEGQLVDYYKPDNVTVFVYEEHESAL